MLFHCIPNQLHIQTRFVTFFFFPIGSAASAGFEIRPFLSALLTASAQILPINTYPASSLHIISTHPRIHLKDKHLRMHLISQILGINPTEIRQRNLDTRLLFCRHQILHLSVITLGQLLRIASRRILQDLGRDDQCIWQ